MMILYFGFCKVADENLDFRSADKITPTMMPASMQRKIRMAADASNFQKRKEMATGDAF